MVTLYIDCVRSLLNNKKIAKLISVRDRRPMVAKCLASCTRTIGIGCTVRLESEFSVMYCTVLHAAKRINHIHLADLCRLRISAAVRSIELVHRVVQRYPIEVEMIVRQSEI